MSTHTLTRRGFIGTAAAVGAAAACAGGLGAARALADDAPAAEKADAYQVHTLCDGCSNECGMTAWMHDGKVWRVDGEEGHPTSGGFLCGRGQGLASQVYSSDRLTTPLKNNGSGKFEEVSWDEALADIATRIDGLGSKLAILQARGNCEPFVKRLAAALGTPNYFTDAAIRNADAHAAADVTTGGIEPVPDFAHAKFAVVLGKSGFDGTSPAWQAALAAGDTTLVLVDARMSSFGRMASKWVPIIPGTELAFLMGIAHELIRTGAYGRSFAAKHIAGFSELTDALDGCSLAWASQITGISDAAIAGLAASLAENAPASFVYFPHDGNFGASYKNSFDTCRMVAIVNALLGNLNKEGGMICASVPKASDEALAKLGIPALALVDGKPAGSEDAPYGEPSCMAAIKAMQEGSITAALLIETNPVLDYPASSIVADALDRLQFLVVADEFMTDTALMADYVLPLTSYLECGSCAHALSGATTPVAALRSPAIERLSSESKSVDELACALADACGKHDMLSFNLEDYNRAWCKVAGVDYDGLLAQGVSAIDSAAVAYGKLPALSTPSGKIEAAPKGLGAPQWIEPLCSPSPENPRLICGQQAIHNASFTSNDAQLAQISKMYALDAVWINKDTAAAKGISTDDVVTVSTNGGSISAPAKVTACIAPQAVWMPVHYGATSPQLSEAVGFGSNPLRLCSLSLEPMTGAAMSAEVLATVEKAGA